MLVLSRAHMCAGARVRSGVWVGARACVLFAGSFNTEAAARDCAPPPALSAAVRARRAWSTAAVRARPSHRQHRRAGSAARSCGHHCVGIRRGEHEVRGRGRGPHVVDMGLPLWDGALWDGAGPQRTCQAPRATLHPTHIRHRGRRRRREGSMAQEQRRPRGATPRGAARRHQARGQVEGLAARRPSRRE